MDNQTTGTVIAATKQWWLKVNRRKPIRMHALDGAEFPYIIKVEYNVGGKMYYKRKWLNAGETVPKIGSNLQVVYNSDKPSKAKIL